MQTPTMPQLSYGELEAEHATMLPRRETLCAFACTNVVSVVGVNVALAVNAASINASANALAAQYLTAAQLH